ncbi:MAG: C-GCAxxG-C-C family protein [Firmicutes bacterium]|nr:C-GCAxxG-C-C family protein [Bacillota bacterium]
MKTAKNFYLEEDFNCCETTIRLANQKYDLGLTEENMRLLSGFGGGLMSGLACGVLCGGVAAISKKLVETRGHDTPALKPAVTGFVSDFEETLGHVNCKDLKVTYNHPEDKSVRCIACVEKGWEVLQKHMDALNEPTAEE